MNMHERMDSIADVYAAGALGAEDRREAEAHAASCPDCAAALRAAGEFHRWMTGTVAPDAPPSDLEARVIARFRSAFPAKRRLKLLPGRRLLAALGTAAAAVGLVLLGGAYTAPPPESASLETLASVQADFRAKDDTFWTEDVRGIYNVDAPRTWKSRGNDVWSSGLSQAEAKDGTVTFGYAAPRQLERSLKQIESLKENEKLLGKETRRLEENLARLSELEDAKGDNLSRLAATPAPEPKPEIPAESPVVVSPPRMAQEGRKLIRTADVDLEVDSYDATSAKLTERVAAEKGFVAGANTTRLANGKIRAVVTVRVPPERFDALIEKIRELGTVRTLNVGSQDVTRAYFDLETRLAAKQALLERLKTLLKEAKGTVKELLEVEVQMGKTIEEIESIKGELKYFDNQVGLSTITLTISEKDLGLPFEYVQTLQSAIGLTARDADDVYAKAQKEIVDAGGQVVDSKMARQNDGSATGTIRGRLDVDKFPAVREAIKKLGHVTQDTVNQQKTARGGSGGPKPDAPLRKEQAVVDVTITTPPIFVTRHARIQLETPGVQDSYGAARKAIEAAGGKIVTGSLTGQGLRVAAHVVAQVDADKFAALVDQLKALGTLKDAAVRHTLPEATPEGTPPLLRERADLELVVLSPPELIGAEHGIVKTVRDTVAGSWKGVLWSLEKLFVGISLAAPWAAILAAGWLLWRRLRRKPAQT